MTDDTMERIDTHLGRRSFIDAAANRNQRIAERQDELVAEALSGRGSFYTYGDWDFGQTERVMLALRYSFASGGDPATAQLEFAKALAAIITDYAKRRAMEECDG